MALKNPDPKLESEDSESGEASPILNYLNSMGGDCVNVVTFVHK
ncbi:Uncharacterized protein dnm_029160 [Desulfonema magnum]|uniref:Uncharacterized protein n=1 Tax=Desulfonema magnum TaxID=45655 RepID=A0A975GMG9_9BACT|nr:Uncharacterized protein dnm_029160 [Desulfonema magnum]